MVQYFKKNPCDIYHAHWTYEFAEAALRIDSKNTIITIHDWPELIYDMFKDYYRKKRLELSNRVFLRGDVFTTVSPYIADMFRKKYKEKEIKVIPNYTHFTDEELQVAAQYSLESPVLISINTLIRKQHNHFNKGVSIDKRGNSISVIKTVWTWAWKKRRCRKVGNQ